LSDPALAPLELTSELRFQPDGAGDMPTITTPPRPSPPASTLSPKSPIAPSVTGDHRITFQALSWDLYDRLSDAVGPRQAIYLAYDGEDLEITTKGLYHEDHKDRAGKFVMIVSVIVRTTLESCGAVPSHSVAARRTLESGFLSQNSLRS
jgi:hypothetical protein